MKKSSLVFFIFVGFSSHLNPTSSMPDYHAINHHHKLTVPDLIKAHGYPVERHHVTTEDGYILELHRIPHPPKENWVNSSDSEGGGTKDGSEKPRPVVFILHGFLCSSASWVVLGPQEALAYILVDNGYDVWMMNFRGTTYSTNHTKWDPKTRRFWDFSWHEMGVYDLPNSIDYIEKVANPPHIDIIGFSMGTTSFFVAMSERPEYNKKVRKMIGMAPSAYGRETRGLLRESAPYWNLIVSSALKHDVLEFPPHYLHVNEFLLNVCHPSNLFQWLCFMTFWSAERSNIYGLRRDLFPLVFQFFPNTASIGTLTHYHQVYMKDVFGQYDYGPHVNRFKYGSDIPPKYDLSKVTTPLYFFWSKGDVLISPKSMKKISKLMPGHVRSYEITTANFSHSSYKWGIDIDKILYSKILKLLSS